MAKPRQSSVAAPHRRRYRRRNDSAIAAAELDHRACATWAAGACYQQDDRRSGTSPPSPRVGPDGERAHHGAGDETAAPAAAAVARRGAAAPTMDRSSPNTAPAGRGSSPSASSAATWTSPRAARSIPNTTASMAKFEMPEGRLRHLVDVALPAAIDRNNLDFRVRAHPAAAGSIGRGKVDLDIGNGFDIPGQRDRRARGSRSRQPATLVRSRHQARPGPRPTSTWATRTVARKAILNEVLTEGSACRSRKRSAC